MKDFQNKFVKLIPLIIGVSLVLLIVTASKSEAEIHKVIKSDGTILYTNRPDLNHNSYGTTNIYTPLTLEVPAQNIFKSYQKTVPHITVSQIPYVFDVKTDYSAPLVHPEFPHQIAIDVKPLLSEGHKIQLFIDGKPVHMPNTTGNWSLLSLPTGSHTMQFSVVDVYGRYVKSSEMIEFTVLRPNTYNR